MPPPDDLNGPAVATVVAVLAKPNILDLSVRPQSRHLLSLLASEPEGRQ